MHFDTSEDEHSEQEAFRRPCEIRKVSACVGCWMTVGQGAINRRGLCISEQCSNITWRREQESEEQAKLMRGESRCDYQCSDA